MYQPVLRLVRHQITKRARARVEKRDGFRQTFEKQLLRSEKIASDSKAAEERASAFAGLGLAAEKLVEMKDTLRHQSQRDRLTNVSERLLRAMVKNGEKVSWNDYQTCCAINDDMSNQWREWTAAFDLYDVGAVGAMASLMPPEMAQEKVESKTGDAHVGAYISPRIGFPIMFLPENEEPLYSINLFYGNTSKLEEALTRANKTTEAEPILRFLGECDPIEGQQVRRENALMDLKEMPALNIHGENKAMGALGFDLERLKKDIMEFPHATRPNDAAPDRLQQLAFCCDQALMANGGQPIEDTPVKAVTFAMAHTLMVTHPTDKKVDTDVYVRLCRFNPALTATLKETPDMFDLHKGMAIETVTNLMPENVAAKKGFSETRKYFVSTLTIGEGEAPKKKTVFSTLEEDQQILIVDGFIGAGAEMTKQVARYPEAEQKLLLSFIEESRQQLMPVIKILTPKTDVEHLRSAV